MSSEISFCTKKCRACMKEGGKMIPMYNEKAIKGFNLPYKLMELTSVQIDRFDGLPTVLCPRCAYHTDVLYKFKLKVQESDKQFRMVLSNQICAIKDKELNDNNEDSIMQTDEFLELNTSNDERFVYSTNTLEDSKVEMKDETIRDKQQDDFNICQLIKNDSNSKEDKLLLNDFLYNFLQKAKENQMDAQDMQTEIPKEISKMLESQDITILYVPKSVSESISESTAENASASVSEQEEIQNDNNIFIPVDESLNEEEKEEISNNIWISNSVESNMIKRNKHSYLEQDRKAKFNESNFNVEESTKADNSDGSDSDYFLDTKDNILGTVNDTIIRIKEVQQENGIEYQCTLCQQNYDQLPNVLLHTVDNHVPSSGPFFCIVCEKDCKSNRELRAHVKTHTGEFPYYCFICQKAYTRKRYLKRHMVCHPDFPRHRCPKCGRRFKTKSELVSHAMTHVHDAPFTCSQCSRVFNHKGNYKRHLISHLDPQGRHLPKYPCKYCGKRFPNNRTLETHLRVHTGEKPFNCGICNKSFSQKGNLLNHMKIHLNPRSYRCEVCGKSFNQRATLRDHALLHTGEKPYVCNVCGKAFTVSAALRRHMFNHADGKPFQCETCGMGFVGKYDLRRHMRVHENRPREKRKRNTTSKSSDPFREELKMELKEESVDIAEERDTETVFIEQVFLPQDFTQVVHRVESEKENEDALFNLQSYDSILYNTANNVHNRS